MHSNRLKPASTQLRPRCTLPRMTLASRSTSPHDTALTLALHRNAPRCNSVGLCVLGAREGIAPRPGSVAGVGAGEVEGCTEGLGGTAQQFKDDWCQLLVGLSGRGEADRQKQIYRGWGGWGG